MLSWKVALMQKLMLMIALSLVLSVGLPLGAAADTKKEAAALSKKAWAINPGPWELMKANFEGNSSSPKYYGCDAPEVARELFLKAVELDPSLAEAWRGLGQATEHLGGCSRPDAEQWLERRWLGPDQEQKSPDPERQELRKAALALTIADAEPMYKRAVEIDPKDYRNWQAWWVILLSQAGIEKDAQKRGEIRALASKNFESAAELKPDDPEIFLYWGSSLLDLLSAEKDPEAWLAILNEAKEALTRYADLSPLEKPEKDGLLNNSKAGAWSAVADMLYRVSQGTDLAPDQAKSLLELSLEGRLQAFKLEPDSAYNLAHLGMVHLSLAATEKEAAVWREYLTQAKKYHIQSFQPPKFDAGYSTGAWITRNWLRLSRQLNNEEKRQAFTLAALDILDQQGLEAVEVLGDFNQISASLNSRLRNECLEKPITSDFIRLNIAGLLPSGLQRDKILAEAEAGLNKNISQIDRNNRSETLQDWGDILMWLAATETAPDKIESLTSQAQAKYQLAAAEAEDIRAVYRRQSRACQLASKESKDWDRKRDWLKSAIKYQKLALTEKPDHFGLMSQDKSLDYFDLISLARMYYQLPEVDKTLSGREERYRRLAIELTLKAAELDEGHEIWMTLLKHVDRYFLPAQLLAAFSLDSRKRHMNWDFDRHYLARAMGLYRRVFQLLPSQSDWVELDGKPKALASNGMTAAGQAPETYQGHITKKVAALMEQIVQVCEPKTMDAWDLAQLAGLHRYLAASGLLTPEYRLLYWQRAEKMLRQALELEADTAAALGNAPAGPPPEPGDQLIHDLAPGQTRPPNLAEQEGRIYDLTLATTELGLLLAERTLWDEDQKSARLKEAEELWARAEKLRPGSSRYARARWAAWRGDLKTLKENLGHNRNDTQALLYPTLEAAREDPALADYVNEPWFRQSWYGFGFQGQEK